MVTRLYHDLVVLVFFASSRALFTNMFEGLVLNEWKYLMELVKALSSKCSGRLYVKEVTCGRLIYISCNNLITQHFRFSHFFAPGG